MDYEPETARTSVPPVTNTRPLPACSYADVAATIPGPADWATTLVDTEYVLPSTYEPADLVNPIAAGIYSGYDVRAVMIPDLQAMNVAATEAGAPLGFASGYRSYWTQVSTFAYWVDDDGYDRALLESARPGHSEHQLGLAIDFMDLYGEAPWNFTDFATESKAGTWLAANAWRYGFAMSYPAGAESLTCYEYEPWHYRYVGPAAAASIHRSGLTLREWIWQRQPAPPPVATPRWP